MCYLKPGPRCASHSLNDYLVDISYTGAVPNEKAVTGTDIIPLPESFRSCIVPQSMFAERSHPDI